MEENLSQSNKIKSLISDKDLEVKGDYLYLVDRDLPDLKGLKVLRKGLFLGEIKKNRFEPSHALAMALSIDDVKYAVNLDLEDEDLAKYIRGEAISLEGKEVYKYKGYR